MGSNKKRLLPALFQISTGRSSPLREDEYAGMAGFAVV
jgi:hypothetical protein